MADIDSTDLTTLTVDLLSAYFASNSVPSEQLSGLIQSTHAALAQISSPVPVEPEAPAHVPAVSIRKSLASRDHIISLVDGKPYKTLKRHLATRGITPAEYRERYKLPADYPLVAPAYSEQRRAVAQKLGLGRSHKQGAQAKKEVADITPVATEASPSPAKPDRKARVASPAAKPKEKPAATVKASGRRPARRALDIVETQAVAETGGADGPPPAKTRKPRSAKADGAKATSTSVSLAAPAADDTPKLAKKRRLSIAKPKADDAPSKPAGGRRPRKS